MPKCGKNCRWLDGWFGVCCNGECDYCADVPPEDYDCELMEEKDLNAGNGVVLVSSGFHLTRIKMLWSRAGGTANVSTLAAPTSSLYTTVHMFFREPLALVKSFVFDR